MTKRLFDIIFSFLGLIIIAPLLELITVLIKVESPGPVFFRGTRIGKNGKPFKMFKFRTMVTGAEELGGPSTAKDDPRLTKIGKFLKKFQLDELPQLLNILKGEMSFVGPRPEVPSEIETYKIEEKKDYSFILNAINFCYSSFWIWVWFNLGSSEISNLMEERKSYLILPPFTANSIAC